jgi:soluble lytic murein transglycosylase
LKIRFFRHFATIIFGVFLFFYFTTCRIKPSDTPDDQLASLIENADLDTLHDMDLSLIERTALENPNAAFYAAYLLERKISSHSLDSENAARADEIVVKLYKIALRDEVVRDESANRLRPFAFGNRKNAMELVGISPATPAIRTLKAASLLSLGYYNEVSAFYNDKTLFDGAEELTSWDRAILLLIRLVQNNYGPESDLHGALLDFFLADRIGGAQRWLWAEITLRELVPFLEAEENAIRGRFYTVDSAYRDALAVFRPAYTLDPRLFSRYGDLLTDLGRSFLYGGYQEEGAALFIRWEAETDDSQAARDFRYICLYYAGRMRRLNNKQDLATEHFTRALEAAPDSLQKDACIWYLIEMALSKKTETGITLLEKWADTWHDGDYFADLYDRIAQWAASKNRFSTFAELFPAIERGNSGLTRAKYAYIIGRALEEGLIPPQDRTPEAFFAIAYNESGAPYYYNEALLYYRTLAGLKLGKEPDFIDKPQQNEPDTVAAISDITAITTKEGKFLEGFFTYGAARYALAWIRDYTDTLPLEELRVFAKSLSENELWGDAIRLCTLYMKRPDFSLASEDIALYFPLGYAELVNRFAEQYHIDRGILFGLIRTESIFIPDIISHAGAGGLMQLMPQTALDTAKTMARQGGPDYVVEDSVDRANPEANIHIGVYFLRHLMDTQATPLHALLSYNGGPNRVRRWVRASDLPPDLFMETVELKETREYGKKVVASAILYNYFYFSLKPDTLIADSFGN